MARKINFCSAEGDGDDHIIAMHGDTQRVRHPNNPYELRGDGATDNTSVKERISLFLPEAFESPPPPRMLAPGFRHNQQLANSKRN